MAFKPFDTKVQNLPHHPRKKTEQLDPLFPLYRLTHTFRGIPHSRLTNVMTQGPWVSVQDVAVICIMGERREGWPS